MLINLTIDLHSYIGHPYWPEMEKLVNIQKESGMNRARSSANRRKALEEYLRGESMTLAQYDELEALANRPFYLDDTGHIEVPARHVEGMLVTMCDTARAANRPCPPDMVRTVLRASAWRTTVSPDSAQVWERYAVVTSGTGAKLSNQRGLRRNWYIGARPPAGCAPGKEVVATGTMDVNPEMVRPDVLRRALGWAGEWVGIGASRKMGWGRFEVTNFEVE
jgi:hypothetical protein